MNSNIEMTADAVPLSELVRRGELLSADCPSREVLKHVTSRWGVLVLMVLLDEQMCRFSDLRRKVDGVSEKMLAQTLQWLAADGFVVRTSYDVVPPHVDYRLTPLGEEVARQVSSLADWIEINLARIMGARASSQGAGESI
ncbi:MULTISPECIES: winged helix-turn-helix transcriptional regulator [Burkholderiaceae]|jgi:DNA-binding HxlR family transcriptional regulator|uniref:Redox-sensing transcriptional regulator QorR n=1 Tax=Caballeronia sordidicola TaxID=196367 RepID=A0A242MAW9_CABSO|nr:MULTISPECIES: helix-turn-helix domain-containing protein [Burkholderiaceae]AMH43127.1 HxlR family transcriptional regulator [Burkholderia sp. PAMC 26561]MDP9157489.1 helix-turn-helix transcriptional regulator [Pseudomonadota bacterium]OTP68438.1 Redox-sensing transcriptional regulator QorR [Caballeronia sordidicola]OTP73086.1 Redox-sensing transcriptional regulator QorR [Caballeronia sordidicola]